MGHIFTWLINTSQDDSFTSVQSNVVSQDSLVFTTNNAESGVGKQNKNGNPVTEW